MGTRWYIPKGKPIENLIFVGWNFHWPSLRSSSMTSGNSRRDLTWGGWSGFWWYKRHINSTATERDEQQTLNTYTVYIYIYVRPSISWGCICWINLRWVWQIGVATSPIGGWQWKMIYCYFYIHKILHVCWLGSFSGGFIHNSCFFVSPFLEDHWVLWSLKVGYVTTFVVCWIWGVEWHLHGINASTVDVGLRCWSCWCRIPDGLPSCTSCFQTFVLWMIQSFSPL